MCVDGFVLVLYTFRNFLTSMFFCFDICIILFQLSNSFRNVSQPKLLRNNPKHEPNDVVQRVSLIGHASRHTSYFRLVHWLESMCTLYRGSKRELQCCQLNHAFSTDQLVLLTFTLYSAKCFLSVKRLCYKNRKSVNGNTVSLTPTPLRHESATENLKLAVVGSSV